MDTNDPAAQLAFYRQQLNLLQRDKNAGPDVAALRLNLREMIKMLEVDLEPAQKVVEPAVRGGQTMAAAAPNTEIFESLNEDKEEEDAVSSDDDMFRFDSFLTER